MGDALLWFVTQIGLGFYNFAYAITHPSLWLDWSDKQALLRFVYYGGSVEFFFVLFNIFLIVTIAGYFRPTFLWGVVRGLEGFANTVGRTAAWAGLIMVLQQIVVIFMQAVFRVSEITISPIGIGMSFPIAWYAEGLKFHNALVVALCCSYTFVQGSHVRVDLIYSSVAFRTKKIIDMFGSIFFMVPMAVLIWMYGWYFLWRSLINPKVSASDTIDTLLRKARVVKWNVETIGFSPSGFNAYFLFKVLLVLFAAMVLLQAVAFFYRSWLEYREGEESHDKYLDRDDFGGEESAEHVFETQH